MLVAVLHGARVDGLEAVAGEVVVGEVFEGVAAVALPEALQLFLNLFVLVDFLLVGGLHVLHLLCQLHQLQLYRLLALLLVVVLHQQLFLLALCQPQLLLQLTHHLLFLVNRCHQPLVALLHILALLH